MNNKYYVLCFILLVAALGAAYAYVVNQGIDDANPQPETPAETGIRIN